MGQWVHVEAYLKQASDHSGQLTVWQDGTIVFDLDGVRTRYADGDNQWSIDNYSNEIVPSPTTVYVDDAAIHAAVPEP